MARGRKSLYTLQNCFELMLIMLFSLLENLINSFVHNVPYFLYTLKTSDNRKGAFGWKRLSY